MLPPAFAAKQETGFLNRTITVAGTSYRFQVHVPRDWNKSKKWPVVLFLHGVGERGDDGMKQTLIGISAAIRRRPDDHPFVVVLPQCREGKTWTDIDTQKMAMAELEQTIREFNGDRDRVVLTGLSMGGYGVWELSMRNPGKFAALVPICGGLKPVKQFPEIHSSLTDDTKVGDPYAEVARLIGKTPVWVFHGTDDKTVPVEESRKIVEAIKQAGGNVRYTEYPETGHDAWTKAYAEPELAPWMLAQMLRN